MGFYRSGLSRTLASAFTAGLALAGIAACNSGQTGPGLRLRLAGTPLTQGCLLSSKAPIDAMALLQSGSIHVSAVQHTEGGQQLLCDATAQVPTEKLDLDLGGGDRTSIDYYAEFYDTSGKRVASGSLLASSADAAATSETPTLHMFAANGWSCPPSVLNHARAFHSATMLPNGEVLLLGGIDAVTGNGSDVFGLVDSAEVYDPRHATFVPISVSTGALAGRAFHSVAVLSSSGNTTRLVVYGGVVYGGSAAAGNPALFLPDSPTQLRLMPGGMVQPGGAQQLDYDATQHTLSVSNLDVSTHRTAFAGGAALPGGGLLVVGGASFTAGGFSRSNPATLTAVTESGTLFSSGSGSSPPTSAFAPGSGGAPWLLGASVTPLSMSTALVLGAKQPPDSPIKMQAQALTGLPASVQFPASMAVGGPSTVFHTATRLGPALGSATGPTQVLVTGGFAQDSAAPYATRQPPGSNEAVRVYSVSDPGGSLNPITEQAIAPYNPTGCGTSDDHYRPAGFEAASATVSGNQVLITGGTPSVPSSGCVDCEATETGANRLLCVLRQASLYDATTQTLSALPGLALGRMGHQQTRLNDGNILITGGLVRPTTGTQATLEAEIYNPISNSPMTMTDPNNPLSALPGAGSVTACSHL